MMIRTATQFCHRHGLAIITSLEGYDRVTAARHDPGHRRSIGAVSDPNYAPVTVPSGTPRARRRAVLASIKVIAAPSASHAAKIASSPQLTTA